MRARSDLIGIFLVIVTTTVITVSDAIAKELSAVLPVAVIAWLRYAVSSAMMLPVAVALRGHRVFPTQRLGLHIGRTACLVFGIAAYLQALAHVPFVAAISAFMVYPILGAALGVLFLGERLTLRKILALVTGVIGALIVLRPSSEAEIGILFAFAAGVAVAFFLLLSRMLSTSEDPVRLLNLQYFLGAVMLAPFAAAWWETPDLSLAPAIVAMALASVIAHAAMYLALARAETSTLAPFFYFELVAAAVIGLVWFGEWPDEVVWLGAAVIAGSGIALALAPPDAAAGAPDDADAIPPEVAPSRLGGAAPAGGGPIAPDASEADPDDAAPIKPARPGPAADPSR